MTHALIIGGGIAGTVTAMALRKAGIDSTVYEAYRTGADDIGAFLTIMSNGLDALRAVDADGTLEDNSFPVSSPVPLAGLLRCRVAPGHGVDEVVWTTVGASGGAGDVGL